MPTHLPLSFIPSPSVKGFNLGPLDIHVYGLMYVVGIALAIWITRRRWAALGGDPELVWDIAIWAVPAGIIGARIYFDITTPADIPPHWWGVLAVWQGGLGVWGGIAAGALVGVWRLRRAGFNAGLFGNAIAPGLLVAQAVGRIGNYFNQELFGKPSGLPWALKIDQAARIASGIPLADQRFATFQPSFLYELIFDLAWAAILVWVIGRRFSIRPWGLFALYVAGYSAYRIFEETIRIDSSQYFLGLRLNFFVAGGVTLAGLIWFALAQRRPAVPAGAGVLRNPAPEQAEDEAEEAGPEADAGELAEAEPAGPALDAEPALATEPALDPEAALATEPGQDTQSRASR
jgi:prolipoprotein diacylglyceryl transferase